MSSWNTGHNRGYWKAMMTRHIHRVARGENEVKAGVLVGRSCPSGWTKTAFPLGGWTHDQIQEKQSKPVLGGKGNRRTLITWGSRRYVLIVCVNGKYTAPRGRRGTSPGSTTTQSSHRLWSRSHYPAVKPSVSLFIGKWFWELEPRATGRSKLSVELCTVKPRLKYSCREIDQYPVTKTGNKEVRHCKWETAKNWL